MPEKENPSGIDFNIPFAEHLGVTGYRQKNGEAEISLQLKPEHLNSWGSAHGGVILGVFDILMGLSAKSIGRQGFGCNHH
jgi:acyl-coenzyme A thioesterase PaaI-like protein